MAHILTLWVFIICLFAPPSHAAPAAAGAPQAGQTVAAPGGVSPPAGPGPGVGGAPPASAPPLVAGYSLVPNGYFDQVSQTAKAAIEAGKANEENLISIVKIAGSIVGGLFTFGAFLGYTEIKSIARLKKEFKSTLKKSQNKLKEAEESLADLQAMESLLIDITFLQNISREIAELYEKKKPGVKQRADVAIQKAETYYKKAVKIHARRSNAHKEITGRGMSSEDREAEGWMNLIRKALARKNDRRNRGGAAGGRPDGAERGAEFEDPSDPFDSLGANTFNIERVISYIAAVMGVIARRADSLDVAVEWAQRSVQHNPGKLSDREFNLACVLALRSASDQSVENKADDRKRAIEIVKRGIGNGTITWTDVQGEADLISILADLEGVAPVDRPSVESAAKQRAGTDA